MKSSESSENNYISLSQELPLTQFPSQEDPLLFFNNKTRLNETFYNHQIGLQILQFHSFQEDFIAHFLSLLTCQLNFISAFILQPNYVYFSMNVTSRSDHDLTKSEIEVQSKMISVLKMSKQLMKEFAEENLKAEVVLSQEQNKDIMQKKFRKMMTELKNIYTQLMEEEQ